MKNDILESTKVSKSKYFNESLIFFQHAQSSSRFTKLLIIFW